MAALNPVRIRLRYPDLDGFVEKFASNVTRGGVFLASRNISPVGSLIAFEIQLHGGEVALAGQGKVSWVKEFNPAEPNRPYGLGVQFVSLDPASKSILARLLRAKEAAGPRRPSAPQSTTESPPGARNGKPAAAPIDTSVDLAAEFGIDDAAVRRVIDQTWMTGARGGDDLADLLKPDPVETATLAQALADLPRLLDSHTSRRRASGGYRPVESTGMGVGAMTRAAVTPPSPASALPPHTDVNPATDPVTDSPSGPTQTETSMDASPEKAGEGTEAADAANGNTGRRGRKRRR